MPDGLTWRDERWGLKAPHAFFDTKWHGYSSGIAKDPCSYAGVNCDRCGDLRVFDAKGVGGKGAPDSILSFTKLQVLVMVAVPGSNRSSLPPGRRLSELPDLGFLWLTFSW